MPMRPFWYAEQNSTRNDWTLVFQQCDLAVSTFQRLQYSNVLMFDLIFSLAKMLCRGHRRPTRRIKDIVSEWNWPDLTAEPKLVYTSDFSSFSFFFLFKEHLAWEVGTHSLTHNPTRINNWMTASDILRRYCKNLYTNVFICSWSPFTRVTRHLKSIKGTEVSHKAFGKSYIPNTNLVVMYMYGIKHHRSSLCFSIGEPNGFLFFGFGKTVLCSCFMSTLFLPFPLDSSTYTLNQIQQGYYEDMVEIMCGYQENRSSRKGIFSFK